MDIPETEADLEPYLHQFIQGTMALKRLEGNKDSKMLCFNTARGGPSDGAWTRPDLTLVCLHPLRLRRAVDIELVSFELKKHAAKDVDHRAVMEAKSHMRYTHESYVAWHAYDYHSSKTQDRIAALTVSCALEGIGLIIFEKHDDWTTYNEIFGIM